MSPEWLQKPHILFLNQGKKEGKEAPAAVPLCKKVEVFPQALSLVPLMSCWPELGGLLPSAREAGREAFYIPSNGRFMLPSGLSLNVTSPEKQSLFVSFKVGLAFYSLPGVSNL